MDYVVSHDALGTHIDWSLESVTARMIDWFWSNMEKGFVLWHPEQHEPLLWPVPPKHGAPLGAIHNAPQTWDDGRRQNLYIRFEKLDDVPPPVRDVIALEHVIVVAGLGFDEEAMLKGDPMGYRIHQWQKSDAGVTGKSSAIGTRRKEIVEEETLTPYLGEPADIAHIVAFLASDAARYITGQAFAVDGGTSIHVPGFARLSEFFGPERRP
jgi:hypothetical protein